jgi:hypothetical protein
MVVEERRKVRAGALRIESYWVFNRDRDTQRAKVAITKVPATKPRERIAVARPNDITRSVRRAAASFSRAIRKLSGRR